jgi:hypothetical protein
MLIKSTLDQIRVDSIQGFNLLLLTAQFSAGLSLIDFKIMCSKEINLLGDGWMEHLSLLMGVHQASRPCSPHDLKDGEYYFFEVNTK